MIEPIFTPGAEHTDISDSQDLFLSTGRLSWQASSNESVLADLKSKEYKALIKIIIHIDLQTCEQSEVEDLVAYRFNMDVNQGLQLVSFLKTDLEYSFRPQFMNSLFRIFVAKFADLDPEKLVQCITALAPSELSSVSPEQWNSILAKLKENNRNLCATIYMKLQGLGLTLKLSSFDIYADHEQDLDAEMLFILLDLTSSSGQFSSPEQARSTMEKCVNRFIDCGQFELAYVVLNNNLESDEELALHDNVYIQTARGLVSVAAENAAELILGHFQVNATQAVRGSDRQSLQHVLRSLTRLDLDSGIRKRLVRLANSL